MTYRYKQIGMDFYRIREAIRIALHPVQDHLPIAFMLGYHNVCAISCPKSISTKQKCSNAKKFEWLCALQVFP